MSSAAWFTVLVALVAAERLVELAVARAHRRWALAHGGVEYGRGHYPLVVAVHTGLLAGCLLEVWLRHPVFLPALGFPALGVVVAAQGLRWWCIRTLGRRWNTRIIVLPGMPLVRRGPYRLLPHPNYVAVVAEVAALPLVHTAWITAVAFTLLNALVLAIRIRAEDRALASAAPA